MSQITKNLGDKLKVTLSRAPLSTAGGYNQRIFEIFGINKSFYPVRMRIEARDLYEYGSQIGFWMATTAPTWALATEAEKDASGFWVDTNGYADPADGESLNVSRWW